MVSPHGGWANASSNHNLIWLFVTDDALLNNLYGDWLLLQMCIWIESFFHICHNYFSNFFANCLPKRRQSHIGSTCLHCAFSNVDSKSLNQSRESHIHCICFSVRFQMFLQIACLRRGIVALVAFVWLFSTVCFQMFLQIACLRRGIVTLVAFVWISSNVGFHMSTQRAWIRAGKVTLIACVWLSLLCIFKCFLKSPAWEEA